MANKNLQSGTGKLGESAPIRYERIREKVDFEIRDIIRAYPEDYQAIKNSLEDWARQWETE